jgi:hypothetical protein
MALLSTSSVAHAQEGPPDNLAPRQEWHGEVRGGVGHEEVFAIAATGADLAMAVGVTEGRLGMFVDADYLTGQTPMGLHMQTFRLAAAGEYRLGRFHVGAGPELMYFNLKLISQEGGAVTTWGIGVVAFIRFDVVRFANHAVFVDVRAHGDSLDTLRNSTSSWGPAATLGVRL